MTAKTTPTGTGRTATTNAGTDSSDGMTTSADPTNGRRTATTNVGTNNRDGTTANAGSTGSEGAAANCSDGTTTSANPAGSGRTATTNFGTNNSYGMTANANPDDDDRNTATDASATGTGPTTAGIDPTGRDGLNLHDTTNTDHTTNTEHARASAVSHTHTADAATDINTTNPANNAPPDPDTSTTNDPTRSVQHNPPPRTSDPADPRSNIRHTPNAEQSDAMDTNHATTGTTATSRHNPNATSTTTGTNPTHTDNSDSDSDSDSDDERVVVVRPRRGVINLGIDLTTLACLNDDPGHIPGFGPILADIARQATHQMAETAQWRFTVRDRNGDTLAEGRLHAKPDLSGYDPYRPSAAQRAFVNARDKTCRAPGCRRPALRCDQDHIRDWAHSHETTIANLCCLCRHHHRAKHVGGFRTERTRYGIDWITPRGGHYTVLSENATTPHPSHHRLAQYLHGHHTPSKLRR